MMIGAMPVGLSYLGAASVARLVQLEGVKATWELSLNFFLSYNYFLCFPIFSLILLFFPAKVT